jgi:hypothetical protein
MIFSFTFLEICVQEFKEFKEFKEFRSSGVQGGADHKRQAKNRFL